jgi:hypothetical protein
VIRHVLAQASPDGLAEEGTTVALNPAALELDVEAFERWVAEGTPEALERAVALYQGGTSSPGWACRKPPSRSGSST